MLSIFNQASNNFYSSLTLAQMTANNFLSEISDIAQSTLASTFASSELSNMDQITLSLNVVWNCEEIVDTDVEFHKGKATCSTVIDYPGLSGSNLVFKADKDFQKLFRFLQYKEIAFSGSTTYDYDSHQASHEFLADPEALKAWIAAHGNESPNIPSIMPNNKE
jgi:hypothetical protein